MSSLEGKHCPRRFEEWISPIVLRAPPVIGTGNWGSAIAKSTELVAGLTVEEKVNITTGMDMLGPCLGNTGVRGDFAHWLEGPLLAGSPLGVRLADFASAIPARVNAAASGFRFSSRSRRGKGKEHRGKSVRDNDKLGRVPIRFSHNSPASCLPNFVLIPIPARQAAGGRNWEGFGGDPFLAGAATVVTIGLSERRCYCDGEALIRPRSIANEQEHYRGGSSASQILVYLWPFAEAVRAGVGSVMCSYNKINQTQACRNSKVIRDTEGRARVSGVHHVRLGGYDQRGRRTVGCPGPLKSHELVLGGGARGDVRNGSVPMARLDDMHDFAQECAQNAPVRDQKISSVSAFSAPTRDPPDGLNGCTEVNFVLPGIGQATARHCQLPVPHRPTLRDNNTHPILDPTVVIEGILNDSNLSQISAVASRADTCLFSSVRTQARDTSPSRETRHAAECANTIVVLHIVGSVLMESWIDHSNVTAVLRWATGTGKPQITYEEGLNIDYRYPYSAIILSTPCWSDGFFVLREDSVCILPREKYRRVAGNEVSQLYLGFPSAYGEPPKMLRGFAQTMLARRRMSVWDVVSQQWVSSSRTIHLEGTFQL
ncbi:hypothetical protein B0H14DRAFT_3637170 [Mycena olivaceomarginata]|nr:hypothetical protein B0H14DRAFT_3637170 [Mycena olivaceomarginata]